MVEGFNKHLFLNYRSAIINMLQKDQFIDPTLANTFYQNAIENLNQYQDFSFFFLEEKSLIGFLLARPVLGIDLIGRTVEVEVISAQENDEHYRIKKILLDYLLSHIKWTFANIIIHVKEDDFKEHQFFSGMRFKPFRFNKKVQIRTVSKGTNLEHRRIILVKKMPLKKVAFRPIRNLDNEFLKEMVFQSLYTDGKDFQRSILEEKDIKKYYSNWDNVKDLGYIARYNEEDIGAIWCRFFPYYNSGYGYVNEDIPEMGIAILEKYRNRGIGQKLLDHLLNRLRHQGIKAVSLSTHKNNPAISLYHKNHFKEFSKNGDSITMLREL